MNAFFHCLKALIVVEISQKGYKDKKIWLFHQINL
jgi:hypothetical protein